eukprot:TRINITY_DN15275_c0_g1_i1.p2 TRINITY_DN15275_c0_g1~~TRINITY_DN15275_c0_g1_i1.p2  ORF type:complete len:364 (+),score=136.91 TRINITY_DN15275_c0_g1_i1:48-1139(+)
MLIAAALCGASLAAAAPSVLLKNAAVEGVYMPAAGVGVGGYGDCVHTCQTQPQCFHSDVCYENPYNAVANFLEVGGVRVDGAVSYLNNDAVGAAVNDAIAGGRARSSIFLTNKVGTLGLGYEAVKQQVQQVLADLKLDYVDLLLLHVPVSKTHSSSPVCNYGGKRYDEVACRLESWRALEDAFEAGAARAIGVSNFNRTHLRELLAHAPRAPAVNQCPYNPHVAQLQAPLKAFCDEHGIVFNGYSPLGRPNQLVYPPSVGTRTLLQEPLLRDLAAAHNASVAQVMQAWSWTHGVPVNPRSSNRTHMAENVGWFDLALSQDELARIDAMAQDTCQKDPANYECNGTENKPPMYAGAFVDAAAVQ